MGSYTLIVGVLKYFLIFIGFVRFRSMMLLSIFAFHCPQMWSHDENVDCPHLYHVIMGSYTLIVGVLKYFLIFFVRFDWSTFVLWCFWPFLLFTVRRCDHMTRMLIVHTCIMWSWDRTPWFLEYKNIFLFWGVLSALILILWGFRPMVLLSIFAFLCPPTWSHDENVDFPHLYQVIMGSYTLIVGVLKYFLILGGFVRFDSDPLVLSSYILAFVHFCFSLSAQVITWRECWLSTPVSCDHGIVHLDCWSIKIFSHFWGVLSALILILWGCSCYGAFVHFCFSLSAHVITWWECWWSTPQSCDHGIVHLDCWSIKIFSHFWGFCPLWFWSFGAFVLWCFCPFLFFSVCPRDHMTRMLMVHTSIMWSWDRTPWLLEY